MKYIFVLFACCFLSCTRTTLDKQIIIDHLKLIQRDSSYSYLPPQGFIATEEIAVQVAEPILFKIYGEDQITDQKPYQVNLIDSVWVINGTLPVYYSGGTFFMVLNKKDGKILSISHNK